MHYVRTVLGTPMYLHWKRSFRIVQGPLIKAGVNLHVGTTSYHCQQQHHQHHDDDDDHHHHHHHHHHKPQNQHNPPPHSHHQCCEYMRFLWSVGLRPTSFLLSKPHDLLIQSHPFSSSPSIQLETLPSPSFPISQIELESNHHFRIIISFI